MGVMPISISRILLQILEDLAMTFIELLFNVGGAWTLLAIDCWGTSKRSHPFSIIEGYFGDLF